MKERIQKILSRYGVASRRKGEQLIASGRVRCNGRVCTPGDSADMEKDEILVDGRPLPPLQTRTYLMLNKPRGYVSTLSDEKGRKNAAQLVRGCNTRVYPVGRLDMDSEGLLLFTNDGALANRLMHPRHEVDKTYLVTVSGFSADALKRIKAPMELDGYRLHTPEVAVLREDNSQAIIQMTIHEGRNRQIRRMCQIAGMEVLRLIRIAEGDLTLGDLPTGKWRYLTDEEMDALHRNHEK